MYIIEVIPLITLPPQAPQLLSYFFDLEIRPGALVDALVGKRKIQGIVLSCTSVEENKIAIKRASFQLKKLTGVAVEHPVVTAFQLKIASWLSHYYYAPLGSCLKTVLPPFFGVKKYMSRLSPSPATKPGEKNRTVAVYTPAKQTVANISGLIKNALKDEGQVLIIVPETVVIPYFVENLDTHAVASLTSDSSNSEYFSTWQAASSGSARIVVATRTGLFLPFRNLRLIIVEDESNDAYKSDMSPRYNTPETAQAVARLNQANLVFTASLPGLTVYQAGKTEELSVLNRSHRPKTSISIVDAVQEMKTGNFSMFSRKFQAILTDALVKKKRILIFSARKAYAGILICKNCGAIKRCPQCDIPMRVYKTPGNLPGGSERMLICYHCSTYLVPPDTCPNCRSNQLAPAGTAGSQKIQEALAAFIDRSAAIPTEVKSSVKTYILDSDLIRTQSQEDELLKKVEAEKSAIVIATQKILSHRYRLRFDFIGIPNADGMTSARDFRTEERFLILFEKLFDFEPENLIVQTYNPASRLLTAARTGEYDIFYDTELIARESLGYPPFTRLAKLTYRHKDPKRASLAARTLGEKLKMVLHQLELKSQASILGPSPASISKESNFYSYNIILKISPSLKKPESILKYVPSDWIIDMDPKNLV